MGALGSLAGQVARRYGSKLALIAGLGDHSGGVPVVGASARPPLRHPDQLALLGIGIGLAFSALGNLIVGAVEPHQTGVASGMNTVMRTLGGALGGQISATFIAGHVLHGLRR